MPAERHTINWFSGEFADKALEHDFRVATIDDSLRRARAYYCIIILVTFVIVTMAWQSFQFDARFVEVTAARIAVSLIAIIFLVLSYRIKTYLAIDYMAVIMYLALLALTAIFGEQIDSTVAILVIRNLIVIYLAYLIRPTRIKYLLGLGLALSMVMVVQVLTRYDLTGPEITMVVSIAIVINLMGYYAGRDAARSLRTNYLLQQRAEQLAIEATAARISAEEANRSKTEYLSALNHELKTPLNSIVGFSNLMSQGFDNSTPEDDRENIRYIQSAGEHMLDIVDQVLDIARVESGYVDLDPRDVPIAEIIEICLVMIETEAAQRALSVETEIPEDSPTIHADPTRMRQILLNFLSNAIKYNRQNGHILIKVEQSDQNVRIAVSDTGEGIPAERMEELFEPFNRLNLKDSNIKGTGIGLSISRKIAEAMGGKMGVDSVVGEGSTFWFELPLIMAE